jgi:DNA glycosylase AlkZ-like
VRRLTAVQAQDYPGAVTSIALRTESQTRQSVEAALNAHEIVRSWPMRGTLHFVPSEDMPWMCSQSGDANTTLATGMAQITALLTNLGGSGPQTGKNASKPWACRMSGSARSG